MAEVPPHPAITTERRRVTDASAPMIRRLMAHDSRRAGGLFQPLPLAVLLRSCTGSPALCSLLYAARLEGASFHAVTIFGRCAVGLSHAGLQAEKRARRVLRADGSALALIRRTRSITRLPHLRAGAARGKQEKETHETWNKNLFDHSYTVRRRSQRLKETSRHDERSMTHDCLRTSLLTMAKNERRGRKRALFLKLHNVGASPPSTEKGKVT